jgi:DNA-binding transcriptional LysR family regulator
MHLRQLDANLIVILDALLLDASVTKAAERLGRSPSAVSHALARLREIFDDPLFVRAGQRLVPTSRATQIAPTVHIIVSGLEGLLHRPHLFDPAQQRRSFTLACRDSFELTLLPQLRSELAEMAPGITLTRRATLASESLKGLRAGQIDFALVEGSPAVEASDISAQKLFDDPFAMLAPEGHPLSGQSVKDRHLKAEGFTLIADEQHAEIVFDANERPRPEGLATVSGPLIAIHTAQERSALVLVPDSLTALARQHVGMNRLKMGMRLAPLSVHLMWHVSQERDECHSWLRDMLRWKTGGADANQAAPGGQAVTA